MRAKDEIIDLGVWAGVSVRFLGFFLTMFHIFPSFHFVPVCGVTGVGFSLLGLIHVADVVRTQIYFISGTEFELSECSQSFCC